MNAQELTLNIAVNLGRIGRWSYEGRRGRIEQFMKETEGFVTELAKAQKSKSFQKTFDIFLVAFNDLKDNMRPDPILAETMFTWANILMHRARLA